MQPVAEARGGQRRDAIGAALVLGPTVSAQEASLRTSSAAQIQVMQVDIMQLCRNNFDASGSSLQPETCDGLRSVGSLAAARRWPGRWLLTGETKETLPILSCERGLWSSGLREPGRSGGLKAQTACLGRLQ